jgi:hypothetical protein
VCLFRDSKCRRRSRRFALLTIFISNQKTQKTKDASSNSPGASRDAKQPFSSHRSDKSTIGSECETVGIIGRLRSSPSCAANYTKWLSRQGRDFEQTWWWSGYKTCRMVCWSDKLVDKTRCSAVWRRFEIVCHGQLPLLLGPNNLWLDPQGGIEVPYRKDYIEKHPPAGKLYHLVRKAEMNKRSTAAETNATACKYYQSLFETHAVRDLAIVYTHHF